MTVVETVPPVQLAVTVAVPTEAPTTLMVAPTGGRKVIERTADETDHWQVASPVLKVILLARAMVGFAGVIANGPRVGVTVALWVGVAVGPFVTVTVVETVPPVQVAVTVAVPTETPTT